MTASSDRNLLFGILALQMDFITREQLVVGMQAWVLEKEVTLAEHLVRAGVLLPKNRQLLEPLVEAHIRQHGDDPQQSLASISSFEQLRSELARLKDLEVDVSIAQIPQGRRTPPAGDPFATISVGVASAQGTRFRILRPHAEGGLGRVSVALDGELGREVALKEIKPERADDLDSRGRFTREAEITGGLEHPGIVPVYGLGTFPDGRPYYAMRFIRGKSLKEAIETFHERFGRGRKGSDGRRVADNLSSKETSSATEENLELRKLLQRLIDVCEAMDYAHSRGILHRDLKPGNIMLGKYGETLVVDWGLAKPLGKATAPTPESQQTDATISLSSFPEAALQPSSSGGSEPTILGSALGTPAFMSPEQAQGRLDLLGAASDVFSLGAILYQILTGQPPYVASSKEELLRKAESGDYPAPHSLRRGIPPPLEAICLKSLAPLATNRYPTCKALAQELERFLADEPVSAHPDTFSERFSRITRRHRTAFLLATAGLVILVIGLFVGLLTVNYFRDVAASVSERNKSLASELQGKNVLLEKSTKELNARLATNFFEQGGKEYQAGHAGQSVANLRQAFYYLSSDDPLRESYMRILIDHTLQSGRLAAPPLPHHGSKKLLAFSPDGVKLATASGDAASIWNVQTGEPVGKPFSHETGISGVAFSLDGAILATASGNAARIWSVQMGEQVGKPLQHEMGISAMAFSTDGAMLATASGNAVRIWNVPTGELMGKPLQHDAGIAAIAFSPDGTKLATASGDAARIWNVQAGEPVGKPLENHSGISDLDFSPDGTKLVTAGNDERAIIWNVQTGEPVGNPLYHEAGVSGVVFSPDGAKLATSSGNAARIWDVQTGQLVGKPLQHDVGIAAMAFSPDGAKLATDSDDNTIRIWNVPTGVLVTEPLLHEDEVEYVVFSPDGTTVVTASQDKTARIWDAQTGASVGKSIKYSARTIGKSQVVFSPDSTKLVAASDEKTVQIWNLRTGELMGMPLQHDAGIAAMAFSPNGTTVATVTNVGTIRAWNTATGAPVGKVLEHDSFVWVGAFSPDGTKVAAASDDNTARIWDMQTGALIGVPLQHGPSLMGVSDVAFSPDGAILATASDDNTARLWNSVTCAPVGKPFQHDAMVSKVLFSRDGKMLATASEDKSARIWNTQTGEPVGKPLRHEDSVSEVDFNADGTELATASQFGLDVQIWNVQTGQPVGELLGHRKYVRHLTFSPDGTKLATGSEDGTAKIWYVPQELKLSASEFDIWCEGMTGQRMDENGKLKRMTPAEWMVQRKKLDGIRVWQDYLATEERRRERFHWIEAAEAEFNKQWFAAAFHLHWAMKKQPGNVELKKRLLVVEQKLKEEQGAAKTLEPKVEGAEKPEVKKKQA